MIPIRPEAPADANAIRSVLVAAFPTDAEARLVELLRARGELTISLVAMAEDRVAGCVQFSPVALEGAATGLGLAPLAVLPAAQRRGIGSALARSGIEVARAQGWPWIVVLGDPAYYARFGFERASEHAIGNEYGANEAFQVLALAPGALPPGGGVARYAAAFGLFDW